MSDRFLWLQNGLLIPIEAAKAAIAIENAGHRISIDGEDVLVEPRGTVDPHDLQQLRKWKAHVILMLSYMATDQHIHDSTYPAPAIGPIVRRLS